MRHHSFCFRILAILVVWLWSSAAEAQIREIPVPQLPDIAIASFDGLGPVIYYNPFIARQVGPDVAEFFRAHEYGHHRLDHLRREFFQGNPYNRAWLRQGYEREADCFAAERIHPRQAQAAIIFFERTLGPTSPDWYHPTGYARAAIIRRCAFGR